MSSDELQSDAAGVNGAHYVAGPPDVTIKFLGSDLEIQGHRNALVAGSFFFNDHFQKHPSSTKVKAPKDIRPGVSISLETVQAAVDYMHGNGILEREIAQNSIPLLLAAKAFDITSLEEQVKRHLTDKLDHQFESITSEIQIIELVDALRELYGNLGGDGDVEIGKQVAGIVTGAAARACCRKFPMLKKSAEFMGLLKEVPMLAYDMLASGVEVVAVLGNGDCSVDGEGDLEMGEGPNEAVTEAVVAELVTKVVEETAEESMEEVVEEVAEEVVQAVEE